MGQDVVDFVEENEAIFHQVLRTNAIEQKEKVYILIFIASYRATGTAEWGTDCGTGSETVKGCMGLVRKTGRGWSK